jgi:hypothetical protein
MGSMRKELIISIIISLTFLSLGFLMLHYDKIGYGYSFFAFLPFIIGYILGKSTVRAVSLWGIVISFILFFLLLYIGMLEGMVCILLSLPIVVVSIALGVLIKNIVIRRRKITKEENMLKASILPFCLFLVLSFVENNLSSNINTIHEVKTEMILPYTTMQVYNAIKSVDTLDVKKSFLMQIDLPIPQKCILEEEKVGGIRTCYFRGGRIVERITELEKGKLMKMDVIEYELTGRKWLGFKEAIYLFDELGGGNSRITRITTYTSELHPRFYWQPLERLGIEQEHDYVLRNLVKDLDIVLQEDSIESR